MKLRTKRGVSNIKQMISSMGPHRSGKSKFPKIMPLQGAIIKGNSSLQRQVLYFSSTFYLLFATAVKKVHLPLGVVPIDLQ